MKKFLAIILAMSFALSMASCGEKDDVVQGSASVDENGNAIVGTTIDGAGKEVDMKAIDGKALSEVKADGNSEAKIGKYTVEIKDAKLIENEGSKLVVVSIDFKNKSGDAVAYDNAMVTDATQAGKEMVAAVLTGVEGVNVLSGVEIIASGDSTTVQKVYKVSNEQDDIKVTVFKFGAPDEGVAQKTFSLK